MSKLNICSPHVFIARDTHIIPRMFIITPVFACKKSNIKRLISKGAMTFQRIGKQEEKLWQIWFLDFSKAGLKTFLLISPTMHDKSSIVRFALFFLWESYENGCFCYNYEAYNMHASSLKCNFTVLQPILEMFFFTVLCQVLNFNAVLKF